MKTIEQQKEQIHHLIDSLSPEQLELLETLLNQIQRESRVTLKNGQPIVRLGGLWADSGVQLDEEDIAHARKEMWGKFGEEGE